jgi:hypothetical protein
MKTLRLVILTTIFTFTITFCAYGATIYYSPGSKSITVPAGTEVEFNLTVTIEDISGNYYVWFVDSIEGELPLEWIAADPATGFIWSFGSGSATATLRIAVPEGTGSGSYIGTVYSKAMATHGYADVGSGLYLDVYVPEECGGAPEVVIDSANPEYLWPPNYRIEDIIIEGHIALPDGCSLVEVGYIVDDEYGVFTGTGTFSVNSGGNFTVRVPVEVSREGSDKDGRKYEIRIYAEDEAGLGTSDSIDVVVHDMRDE